MSLAEGNFEADWNPEKKKAPMTDEAYRLLRKRTHVQLGVSLCMLWMKERIENGTFRYSGEHPYDALTADPKGIFFKVSDVEALLSSASVDAIMETCSVRSADGQD